MLRIGINPSPLLAALLSIVHITAGACLLAFLPDPRAAAILTVPLFASLLFHLRRDALRLADDAVIEVALSDDGRCELRTRGGTVLEGKVAGSSFVSVWLTVVNIRLDHRHTIRSVVVLPDCATSEDRRRLRVWLRYQKHPELRDSHPS